METEWKSLICATVPLAPRTLKNDNLTFFVFVFFTKLVCSLIWALSCFLCWLHVWICVCGILVINLDPVWIHLGSFFFFFFVRECSSTKNNHASSASKVSRGGVPYKNQFRCCILVKSYDPKFHNQ